MWKDFIGELANKPVVDLGKAVRDVMRRGVHTCQLDTTVEEIAHTMAANRTPVVAVVDADGEAVGMVTEVDVMRVYTEDLRALTAEKIMQPKAQVVAPDTLVIEAVHVMRDRGIEHLLIKGEPTREVPVGTIAASDIVREMAGLAPERPEVKLPNPRGND